MDVRDRPRDTSARGQAMEFHVWTDLIEQSRGALHIFLPLLDRGTDGVAHRLADGEYIPIQVKSRGALVEGMLEVTIRGDSLVDDRALIVAGLLTDEGPGPVLLVVDEGTFKRLAARDWSGGHEVFSAAFSMHPTDATHWRPYLVERSELAARVLGAASGVAWAASWDASWDADLAEPAPGHNRWLGFLGEAEVVRRLAECQRLDLFRPFPDLEMVELLARNSVTRRWAGLQVKAAIPAEEYGEAHLHVRKSTYSADASTWLVGLAWLPAAGRFADECLLVPAARLPEVAVDDGDHLVLNFHPESPERTVLDPYRRPLARLGAMVESITRGG